MKHARQIIQATTLVTAIALVVKGLGFAEKVLLAYFFGTGIQVDAYLVAYSLPFSAYIVLREVVKPAFLPTFLRQAEARDAWRLFSNVGTLLCLLLGLATAAAILLAEPLISLAAPGFGGEQRLLAVRLTRLVMPALLLLGLSTLTTATLHAGKRFIPPALGDVSFRAGPLLLLLAFGGVPALALGAVLGALGKLLIEIGALGRAVRRVRPALDLTFEPLHRVGKLAAPLLAALFLSLFIGPLVENAFASKGGVGGVAALTYARKIAETLTTILPYTLGLVLLPFSAEMAARRDEAALARTLTQAVRGLTLLFLPATVGLLLLRRPFIRLLFERGAFDAASTQLTAAPLAFYALALLPFALEVVVVQFFFARQDTLTPVLSDAAAFALNVALIPPLMAVLGLGGIALAAAVAKGLKVLALLFLFGRRVPAFRPAALGPFLGQMLGAGLATAAVLLALQAVAARFDLDGWGALAAYLALAGALGGGVFAGAAFLLRVEEVRDLARRLLP
ncbi:MAG TPA: murein biosynthesis integral membrane protein MurJ [Anaerolineae bacterium]|nr:murein biosynthesis integral membrane protein MurJ [Anaerolineae bacterium]